MAGDVNKTENNQKIEQYMNLLSEVASMYYEHGMIQSEIAERMCISRSRISRLLDEARQEGIVSFQVKKIGHRSHELEEILKRQFRLREAIVVNDTIENYDRIEREQSLLQETQEGSGFKPGLTTRKSDHSAVILGSYAAEVFEKQIKPDMTIGMSWGRSVAQTVYHVNQQVNRGLKVVQVIGGAMSDASSVEQMQVVVEMIRKLRARGYFLQAPLFMDDLGVKRHLIHQPMINNTLKIAHQSDIILTGIGDMSMESFSFMWQNFAQNKVFDKLSEQKGVGFICGQCYDIKGQPIQSGFNEHVIGIGLPALRKIPTVIGIAGGLHKAKAVLGVLAGEYVDILVTDRECVLGILKLLKGEDVPEARELSSEDFRNRETSLAIE